MLIATDRHDVILFIARQIFSHLMRHNSGLMLMNQEANCGVYVLRRGGGKSALGLPDTIS